MFSLEVVTGEELCIHVARSLVLKVMSSTWSRHTRPLSPAFGLGSIAWASEKGRKVEKAGTFLVLSETWVVAVGNFVNDSPPV